MTWLLPLVAHATIAMIPQGSGAAVVDDGSLRWLRSGGGYDVAGIRPYVRGGRIDTIGYSSFMDHAAWLATDTTVAFSESGSGVWTEVDLPSIATADSITPIGPRRALVARGDELLVVDKDQHVAVAATGHGRLGAIADDGHGGAYIVTAAGLAHWTAGGWTPSTTFTPVVLARERLRRTETGSPDGYVGANDTELVEVQANAITWRVPIGEPGGRVLAITMDRLESRVAVVTATDSELTVQLARVGAKQATTLHVDLPRWWRRRHDGHVRDVALAALLTDDGLFIATADLALRIDMGTADRAWHTYPMSASPAEGEEDANAPRHGLFSLAGQAGYALRAGTKDGAAIGLRPELVFVPSVLRSAFGLGGYVELAIADGSPRESWLGGGLTLVRYGRDSYTGALAWAVALSGGAAVPFGAGRGVEPEGSVFLGLRSHKPRARSDGPVGLRFDVRLDTQGAPSTFTLSLTADLLAGAGSLLNMLVVGPRD